jgi:hypothetical protein
MASIYSLSKEFNETLENIRKEIDDQIIQGMILKIYGRLVD